MTKDRERELLERVGEIERRVKELEAQPREYHYHYHPPAVQQPYTSPVIPGSTWIGDPPYQPNSTAWVDNVNGTMPLAVPVTSVAFNFGGN
jgi:hypothetical protein